LNGGLLVGRYLGRRPNSATMKRQEPNDRAAAVAEYAKQLKTDGFFASQGSSHVVGLSGSTRASAVAAASAKKDDDKIVAEAAADVIVVQKFC
jgi:hypothetical protein